MIGKPATGNKGFGISRDKGRNLVPENINVIKMLKHSLKKLVVTRRYY